MDQSNQGWNNSGISDRMRDLLARASQDHVYEQRYQDATSDEVKQRLDGIEWVLREIRERELGGLTGQLDTVHGRVSDLNDKAPSWAEALAEHIEQLAEQVKPAGELPSVRTDVGAISANVDDALGRLQTIVDHTQRSLQHVETLADRLEKLQVSMEGAALRFTRLDNALGGLTERADRLEAQMSGIGELVTGGFANLESHSEQRIGALEQSVGETVHGEVTAAVSGAVGEHLRGLSQTVESRLDAVTDNVRHSVDGLGARVDVLGGHVEAVGGHLEGIDGRIEGVDGRLDGVDGRIEGVQGRLDGVEGQFQGVDGRFDGLEGRFEKLDGHFEAVDGRFDKIDGHVEGITARFEKVDGHFDGMRGRFDQLDGHAGGTKGHLEAVHGKFDKIGERFENLDGKLDTVDDRLEAVNQRVGQLPATLDIAELRDRLNELTQRPVIDHTEHLDSLRKQIAENVEPISGVVSQQPDRGELQQTVSTAIESNYQEIARRLASLEDTMLTLAEALLRPQRDRKSGGASQKQQDKE